VGDGLIDIPDPPDLYDYRGKGDEAPHLWMPYNQGDVFKVGVDFFPAGYPTAGHALLFMHPCTMRTGVSLRLRVTVVPVELASKSKILLADKWRNSFKVMPLPDLLCDGGSHKASFMEVATVDSASLVRTNRVAILSAKGRQCLQQRFVYHLTRNAPSVRWFEESTQAVDVEISNQAEWTGSLVANVTDLAAIEEAEREYDAFLSTTPEWADEVSEGSTPLNRRQLLGTSSQTRVVQEIAAEIEKRIAADS
jgi:hypothetical protein